LVSPLLIKDARSIEHKIDFELYVHRERSRKSRVTPNGYIIHFCKVFVVCGISLVFLL